MGTDWMSHVLLRRTNTQFFPKALTRRVHIELSPRAQETEVIQCLPGKGFAFLSDSEGYYPDSYVSNSMELLDFAGIVVIVTASGALARAHYYSVYCAVVIEHENKEHAGFAAHGWLG
jgi:hypothetical protein